MPLWLCEGHAANHSGKVTVNEREIHNFFLAVAGMQPGTLGSRLTSKVTSSLQNRKAILPGSDGHSVFCQLPMCMKKKSQNILITPEAYQGDGRNSGKYRTLRHSNSERLKTMVWLLGSS